MNFKVERNRTKFFADWKISNGWFNIKKEFTVGDCCFLLEFFSDFGANEDKKLWSFQLSKKLSSQSSLQLPSLYNLQPHQIQVSKDGAAFQVMPQTISVNQWGPVYWDVFQPVDGDSVLPMHLCVQQKVILLLFIFINDFIDFNIFLKPFYQAVIERLSKHIDIRVVLHYESDQSNVNAKVEILDHLARLLNEGTGSDIDFIVQGEKIPAHSFILQGGISPVFSAMFEHKMTESSSRTVAVEDIEPNVFRQLLRFLYTGDAPGLENDENMAELLFIAADKYQVSALKDLCLPLISKAIDDENAVRLLVLAHLHSAVWLQEDCIDWIVKNKTIFFQREEFRDLSRNYSDLFFGIGQRL